MSLSTSPGATAGTIASPRVESIDPASGQVLKTFEMTPAAAVPGLLDRARTAQKEWGALSLGDRRAAVRRLRNAIYARREEIVDVISRETGKPRVEAIFAELIVALDSADYLSAQAGRWLRPERVAHHNIVLKAKSGRMLYEPVGVLGVIAPWNYPFAIPMAQIIPALLAGNAVMLKPSELTPWTGALIGELAVAAKLPENLLQVLQGAGETGAALVEAAPDKIFFTGSVETGKRIAAACAAKLIPSVLELGGKDPMIVLADADLDAASSAAVWGSFTNCGQACLSVERIYVEQSVAPRFTQLCVEKTKKLRVGPSSNPESDVGPLIRLRQLERVESQLLDAVQRGARILTGGRRVPELGPNFFEPAVVTNVDQSMRLMREETFGPVLVICSVASVQEAVALANDSEFGLSASVWTRGANRGKEAAGALRAGSVMINDVASYYGIAEAPHGGTGASGWGRTHSRFGFLEMVHVKYVSSDKWPGRLNAWWYGYSGEVAVAAAKFAEVLFAPNWRDRCAALLGPRGARKLLARRNRI